MPTPPLYLTHNGETKTITEWAAQTRIPVNTIRSRINLFRWSISDALTIPIKRQFSSRRSGRKKHGAPRPCPELKHHSDGSAFVRWSSNGKRHWKTFGPWGSSEAQSGYQRFCLEWITGIGAAREIESECTVAELADLYTKHAEGYYRKNGKVTSEYHIISSALCLFASVCGDKFVAELKPDDLRLVVRKAVQSGKARETCNSYKNRILRALKWGCTQTGGNGKPLVPGAVHYALSQVETLAAGRTEAPDAAPIRAVAWADVEATFPHLNAHEGRRAALESLVRFHWLTGMRSSDLLRVLPTDLDKTHDEWCYRPDGHKQQHTGEVLEYFLGPKAIAILAPILEACPDDRPIFALPPRSKNGAKWWTLDKDSYGRLIKQACERKGGISWHPHQLRHARATEVARIYESDEMAAAAIGDTPEVARRIYVDPNSAVKRRIARETG